MIPNDQFNAPHTAATDSTVQSAATNATRPGIARLVTVGVGARARTPSTA